MSRWVLFFLFIFFLGCDSKFSPQKNYGLLEAQVVGGNEVTINNSFWRHVAFIKSHDDYSGFSCSAAIISKRTLVTAAHCLVNLEPRDLIIGFIQPNLEKSYTTAKSFYLHPDFVGNYQKNAIERSNLARSHDVAVILLSQEIPEPFTAIDLNYSPNAPEKGSQVFSAGFGLTRVRGLDMKRLTKPVLRFLDFKISDFYLPNVISLDQQNGKSLCSGDSGGPVMQSVDTGWQLLGINRATGPDCQSDSDMLWLAPQKDFINQFSSQ